MCNHIHLLLEVPPLRAVGLSDSELLERLSCLYNEAVVMEVAKRLKDYRDSGCEEAARELHSNFTYRMHSLSEFMKGFMQRFTQWFNRKHERSGGLWEDAFKSVLVEDGVASRTMAAYIDLNPVRAGMVTDPADYRWSSYGEAIGGGARVNGRTARAGLVRAIMAHKGYAADARHWAGHVSKQYRMILLAESDEKLREVTGTEGGVVVKVATRGMKTEAVEAELARLGGCRDVALGKMLRCRVRYFTDGAVIGSRNFVDEVFHSCRSRFGAQRKNGARKLRGSGTPAAGVLWSARALQKQIG
jgi:putative transposase